MLESTLTDQIEMLRVHLETTLLMPLLVSVSSARSDDGKGIVAWEVARSMDAAGYSTLLVLADEQAHGIEGGRDPRTLDDVSEYGFEPYVSTSMRLGSNVLRVPNVRLRNSVTRESVKRFTAACRKAYQVTVIETASIGSDPFATLTGMNADGVLLSIREGRRVRREDRELADTLAAERISFLGVVSVAGPVVKNERFGLPRRRVIEAAAPVAAVPARHEQAV